MAVLPVMYVFHLSQCHLCVLCYQLNLFQYSQFGNMVLPTVLNNFKYLSFIRFSNEESELKTPNLNIGVYIFCLDSFIWLVGQFYPCKAHLRLHGLLFVMLHGS